MALTLPSFSQATAFHRRMFISSDALMMYLESRDHSTEPTLCMRFVWYTSLQQSSDSYTFCGRPLCSKAMTAIHCVDSGRPQQSNDNYILCGRSQQSSESYKLCGRPQQSCDSYTLCGRPQQSCDSYTLCGRPSCSKAMTAVYCGVEDLSAVMQWQLYIVY